MPRTSPFIALTLLLGLACADDDAGKKINQTCLANTDCASDVCHHGACAAANPLNNGQPCSSSAECRSFNCYGGTCRPGNRALGQACLYHDECFTNLCNNGVCVLSAGPDLGHKDSGPDAGGPDLKPPDAAAPDRGEPDQAAPDQAAPDQAAPDQAIPDQAAPDQLIPDQIVPDMLQPDTKPPNNYTQWSSVSTFPASFQVTSIWASGKVVMVGGGKNWLTGGLYRTDDGGKKWTQVITASNVTSVSMQGLDGAAVDNQGRIYRTYDGGVKWTQLHDCWQLNHHGAVAYLDKTIVAVGWGKLCRIDPAGKIFDTAYQAGAISISLKTVALTKVGGKAEGIFMGWRVVNPNGQQHYVYRSSDGGVTWKDDSNAFSVANLYMPEEALLFPSGRVLAVGRKGYLHEYDPKLKIWFHNKVAGPNERLYDLAFEQPAVGKARVIATGTKTFLSTDDAYSFTKLSTLPQS